MGKDKVVPFLLEDKLKELGAKYEKVLLTRVHFLPEVCSMLQICQKLYSHFDIINQTPDIGCHC